MSRPTVGIRPITPEDAAEMLFARGIVPALVETDTALAEALWNALMAASIRVGSAPNDFGAVRVALTRLAYEAELSGRRRECRRYQPESSRRR
ncbi:hypothetical protein VQ02_33510 [Methylobacterium variabile]|uniref:Uncharacterized protein n=1 Tax=Methylobacterium variabile TaxID=298794 RepID=A0A0J6S152_9HYPH|nr:hypothetical protein [Methylobacterium variabile]KMO27268.1 hypothetical protein VQ02_33510 [Methylobacterium variabile]